MRKRFTLALLSLLLVPLAMMAQDVTISPSTGNLMAALTQDEEIGSQKGWSSTWKHSQLALTLTVSDFCNLTEGGESANPAGNIIQNGNNYVFYGGQPIDCFMTISLPKGFRFTGYEIVLLNNMVGKTVGDLTGQRTNKIFFETDDLSRNVKRTDMVYPGSGQGGDYDFYSTIRDEIYANNPHYLAVARQGGAADGEFRMAQDNEPNTEYVISRTSLSSNDMGNHLYFRLNRASSAYGMVTIKSARFYFTAEGNFTEEVGPKAEPTSVTTTGVNYMYAPFTTGKLDLGEIEKDQYGHYTYKYQNVRDLEANNVIYQENAVSDGALPATPGAGGIFGTYNNGNYYYGLKNNTYFVETPTMAPTSGGDGSESPVGFRITGAKVHYAYGVDATGGPEPIIEKYDEFTISSGNYYLGNGYGRSTTATNWFMDKDGYVRCGTNGGSYLTIASRDVQQGWSSYTIYYMTTTSNVSEAVKFKRNGGYLQVNGGEFNNYYVSYGAQNNSTYYWRLRSNTNNSPVSLTNTGTQASITVGSINVPAFTAEPYTLTVYEKDGTTPHGSAISVNSTNTSGTVELTGLNNDAIKFKVEGLEGTDAKALITVELTMQALDPYIDQMSVVVYDPQTDTDPQTEGMQPLRLSQGFTASDFSVSGGEFDFYLPGVCSGHEVQITFEDLYSHYADESYTVAKDGFNGSASHFSRFNFVKSDHYNAFNNAAGTSNNIYDNYSEAANPQEIRVKVGTVGTAPFKFNNAADVSAGNADYFIEYPFSLEAYAAAPNNGSFIEQKFTVSSTVQQQTSYVFTTDETAYNIAPTKATQHRVYAFYTMVTNVKSETYNPQIAFTKIYDETLYIDEDGKPANGAFYRATVTAVDGSGNAGYATTEDIFKIIDAAVNGTASNGTVTEGEGDNERTIGTYTGKDSKLTSAKQLLCLDFSNLKGVFQVTTEQHGSMDDYSNTNADNCLIFLPLNATAPNNNVAYKTKEGKFRAAHSIVLTDRQPFYSPYDIQVDAAETVTYQRQATTDKYGNIQHASMILPFIITVDEETGVHTNPDNSSFTVYTMRPTNAISKDEESTYAYFAEVNKVTTTTANTPYLIKLDKMSAEETIKVVQTGSTIYASTGMEVAPYTATGTSSQGSVDGATVTFTPTGTFAGMEVEKTKNIFYFANNQFVNSADYKYNAPIRILPFRTFFATSGMPASNIIHTLNVVFGENPGSETDGIDAMSANVDVDMNAPVFDLQGRKVANGLQNAHLMRGIYVINGVKVIVK